MSLVVRFDGFFVKCLGMDRLELGVLVSFREMWVVVKLECLRGYKECRFVLG